MFTKEDLLNYISINELNQLSYIEDTPAAVVIDDAIAAAVGYVASFISIPEQPTRLLQDICAELTIIELKLRQGLPKDALSEQKERQTQLLIKMSRGNIPTSTTSSTPPRQKLRAFRHGGNSWKM